jgi:cystathionine beta-lyase
MKRAPSTEQIHHPYQPPEGFTAVPPGVYKASTILFKDCAEMRRPVARDEGYIYGLHATPTSFTLMARIATLEGGRHCLLAPSGLAAVTTINLALLRPGDEVLIPDNVYGQNRVFSEGLLKDFGVAHRVYDPLDAAAFEAMIAPATKLAWIEAAGSITMEYPDLLGLVRACRAKGVKVALDNTWGTGLAFDPFDLERRPGGLAVDVSMNALTKYPSGGADLLMGSIVTADHALHKIISQTHRQLGVGVGMNDVEMVLRGLPSTELRFHAQDRTTRTLAQWMTTRPEVVQVLHPALPGSPGHPYWAETCTSAGCLFSVIFKDSYTQAQVDAFVDGLELFGIGYSWAGPMSLAVPYDMAHSRNLALPYESGHLVRFAIGLEAAEDLRADIEQALAVFAA